MIADKSRNLRLIARILGKASRKEGHVRMNILQRSHAV
jgi:hypothetical protein